jgi:DNA polymerase-1
MYDVKKDIYIWEKDVKEKHGVEPKDFVFYQSILGDKVDNIQGIKGIGPKKAAEIVEQTNKNELKESYVKIMKEHETEIKKNKELVKLTDDLLIDNESKQYIVYGKSDFGKFLEKMEINSEALKKYSR